MGARPLAGREGVLVRCQAGLNRSGLVTALVLLLAGWEPGDAVRHIRARRSPHALFNRHFVRRLVDAAPAVIAERPAPRPPATESRPPIAA